MQPRTQLKLNKLHKLRDCLQFTAHRAPIPNSHIDNTSSKQDWYSPFCNKHIFPAITFAQVTVTFNCRTPQITQPIQREGGTSRPNAPTQYPMDTLPTIHHNESWKLHPKRHWTCSGPQDPHSHRCLTAPQLGTHMAGKSCEELQSKLKDRITFRMTSTSTNRPDCQQKPFSREVWALPNAEQHHK